MPELAHIDDQAPRAMLEGAFGERRQRILEVLVCHALCSGKPRQLHQFLRSAVRDGVNGLAGDHGTSSISVFRYGVRFDAALHAETSGSSLCPRTTSSLWRADVAGTLVPAFVAEPLLEGPK